MVIQLNHPRPRQAAPRYRCRWFGGIRTGGQGGPVDRRRAWVIGDTPLDAACARAGGVRCLLVASGFAPRADLEAAPADHVVDDLTDTEAILSLLS